MITVTKQELINLGFGPSQSADIIRQAKYLMQSKGFSYYASKRLGRVPVKAVEEILGFSLESTGDKHHA
ncbi:DUF3173 domain-containing protein [Metasolibacillus sp.]|uniref:DUF3173 domain-containing protein n=1 Tax=Metasolibacillus sp. TaxID=2703680 RepID=UPI0025CBFCA7|nr:DUF3173 domain-containing protein [Metasolibacillus sp.]MCT6925127.1 DUF3173 domain-containing protein [Metasolibacillus sp.]MCT6941331.1 DUF3173 domain-containing protein [Metasolibacillus sp.]